MVVAAALAIKLAAYTLWSRLGLRLLRQERPELMVAALFGFLRLVIGLVAGAALMALMTKVAPAQDRLGFSIPVFVVAMTLVRWVEWGFLAGLIARRVDARSLFGPPFGWKAGGLALSYATDAAAFGLVGALGWMPC